MLQKHWRYPAFRPLQEEIITSVTTGRDTLALLPTGGGKSICYQIPALLLPGVTIVVSPLIALMKDQVQQLRARGIVAEAVYGGMRKDDIDRIFDNAVHGNTKLLYLSPERLTTELARTRIRRMEVSLVAVDEAHCISQWGYDFRPPYLKIAELREMHPEAAVIAVTATATPEVVVDIQEQLKFRKTSQVFTQSFRRDNLNYVVRNTAGKEAQLLKILKGVAGSSVVYVRSRGLTREIALQLQRRGIAAAAFHAGMTPEDRDKRQESWLSGRLRVMVATNAFGMGIDKADVRSVIHYGPPDNPEAYFQEAGRGGRDGKASYAVLLYHPDDRRRLERHYELAYPPLEEIKRMYRSLGSYLQLAVGGGQGEAYDFDLPAFSKTYGFDVRAAHSGLKALERAGYVVLTDAIHLPASLQFVVDKETLYDYQLKNPQVNKLVKSVLRTSQGAFVQPVGVKEGSLANFLKVDLARLRATLRKMAQDGIIAYFPEKESPQLIFTEERIAPENLRIDAKAYVFLKDRARLRLDTMLAYCEETNRCRTRLLLEYFGETTAEDCGNCDICRAKDTKSKGPDARAVYRLVEHKTLLEDVYASYGRQEADAVSEAVQHLLNEGLLKKEGDHLLRP